MATIEYNRNTIQTIDVTASVISVEKDNSNFKRKSIIIINTSTGGQKISLAIAETAVSGYGIVLSPGGSWQDSQESGYSPTQREITAISDIAGGTIAIQERTGV